jgi:uncharacterized RDD family membrane protein YckC
MSDLPGQTTGSTGAPPGEAPQQPVAYSGSGPSGPRANFGQRLLAYIVDALILAIPYLIVYFAISEALGLLVIIVGAIAYYVVLQGGPTGQTVGKKVMNIRVVDFNTGGPIGYGRAFVRYLVQGFLSGILFLGYLWMLWDREKQTWHDKASRSVVVPVSAYPIQ